MKLTEAKLKQMILEAMYTPRNLVKAALSDPEVDQRIKDLLLTDNYDDMKQGFSLLQSLYPEKYETQLKILDPERAEMADIARKNVEKAGRSTFDTNHHFEPRRGQNRFASSEKLFGTHFGASRIDDPDYEKEFRLRNDPLIRMKNRIESEYFTFVKELESRGRVVPELVFIYNKNPKSNHYNKLMVQTMSSDNAGNGPFISEFHELLNKEGYSTGEIERTSRRPDRHHYKFEVY